MHEITLCVPLENPLHHHDKYSQQLLDTPNHPNV